MDRVEGDRNPPVEGDEPSSSPGGAAEPMSASKHGTDLPSGTKLADVNTAATAEQYPSYIRRKSAGMNGEDDGGERETEKGYVGGDRVRLLVGR